MDRTGYDPTFLGDAYPSIPLPTFSSELNNHVLQDPSIWLPYIHYSVATNTARRQPICVALNIDQNLKKSGTKRGGWSEDSRISPQYQLNNDYYKNNDWDRGHMARRSTSAWGETMEEAQKASDDTMFYTNSCLQHGNLNQDEWLDVEDWVVELQDDANGKISSFSGPIYGYEDGIMEFLKPADREAAEIPAAFYKIVTFIGKETNAIETRAFILVQNTITLKDKLGRKTVNLWSYQVSIKMIEEATGLKFDEILGEANPIPFKPGTNEGMPPVGGPTEMINPGITPPEFDDDSQIFIAAASINPSGDERANEWVSVANYSPNTVNLDGWTLTDQIRKPLRLSGTLQSGETIKINPLKSADGGSLMLRNSGGVLTMKDSNSTIISRVLWGKQKDGSVKVFG